MRIWAAIIAPMVVLMMTTVSAAACSAIVVNTSPNETTVYTCWAANLTTVSKTEPVALPKFTYPAKKKKRCKRKRKCS